MRLWPEVDERILAAFRTFYLIVEFSVSCSFCLGIMCAAILFFITHQEDVYAKGNRDFSDCRTRQTFTAPGTAMPIPAVVFPKINFAAEKSK